MEKRTVLLVEDNVKLNEINRRALERHGYEVLTALTLAKAREHLSRRRPDVILLDIELPDGSGLDFCGEIRGSTNAHIIFLTSRAEHIDQLRGLAFGGDDYITKPFKLDMMVQRVASAMRRRDMDKEPVQTIIKGILALNLVATRAYVNGVDLELRPKEYALLQHLVKNEGRLISGEVIYAAVWGQPMMGNANSIRVTASRLRKKLEGSGYTIVNEQENGYCFERGEI